MISKRLGSGFGVSSRTLGSFWLLLSGSMLFKISGFIAISNRLGTVALLLGGVDAGVEDDVEKIDSAEVTVGDPAVLFVSVVVDDADMVAVVAVVVDVSIVVVDCVVDIVSAVVVDVVVVDVVVVDFVVVDVVVDIVVVVVVDVVIVFCNLFVVAVDSFCFFGKVDFSVRPLSFVVIFAAFEDVDGAKVVVEVFTDSVVVVVDSPDVVAVEDSAVAVVVTEDSVVVSVVNSVIPIVDVGLGIGTGVAGSVIVVVVVTDSVVVVDAVVVGGIDVVDSVVVVDTVVVVVVDVVVSVVVVAVVVVALVVIFLAAFKRTLGIFLMLTLFREPLIADSSFLISGLVAAACGRSSGRGFSVSSS